MRNKVSVFNNAQNINIKDTSLTVNVGNVSTTQEDHINLLFEAVALNAILNAGGRADEVRCYPGTREEIIGKVERWMAGHSQSDHRMLWLKGHAGAGKSAIAQTLAERGADRVIHAANFFFFRGDNTRNHAHPIVATLIYQLIDFYPALREHLTDSLEAKPLTLKASVEEQFARLLAAPIQAIHDSSPIDQQIVLIVDGLDECDDEGAQIQILSALHALVSREGSPFRVVVASRAEPHLVMYFNKIGGSVESIFLSDEYRPEDDIRKFVAAKFDDIKRTHHLAHTLSDNWPDVDDIHRITTKSSSHFIYAATVMRYIEYSKDNPSLSLLTIHEIQSSIDHSPFAQLDAVYLHIFSKARDIRVIKWVFMIDSLTLSVRGREVLKIAGYETMKLQSLFADISAIAQISFDERGVLQLDVYHASLYDYLTNKSRSGKYHLGQEEIAVDLSTVLLQGCYNRSSLDFAIDIMAKVDKPTTKLSRSLLDASNRQSGVYECPHKWYNLIVTIERLYFIHDRALYRRMLRSWIRFAYRHGFDPTLPGVRLPDGQRPDSFRYYNIYMFTERVKYIFTD